MGKVWQHAGTTNFIPSLPSWPERSSPSSSMMLLALTSVIACSLAARGFQLQSRTIQSQAVCLSDFSWADNSVKQSPCYVAALVNAPCNQGSTYSQYGSGPCVDLGFWRLDCSGSKRFYRLRPSLQFKGHIVTLHLVGTTLSESFMAIHHSFPAPGHPTTLSVLVQIVKVFQMRLQGMNDHVIWKQEHYTDAVDCVAGQRTPLTVLGYWSIREWRRVTLFANTESCCEDTILPMRHSSKIP